MNHALTINHELELETAKLGKLDDLPQPKPSVGDIITQG